MLESGFTVTLPFLFVLVQITLLILSSFTTHSSSFSSPTRSSDLTHSLDGNKGNKNCQFTIWLVENGFPNLTLGHRVVSLSECEI